MWLTLHQHEHTQTQANSCRGPCKMKSGMKSDLNCLHSISIHLSVQMDGRTDRWREGSMQILYHLRLKFVFLFQYKKYVACYALLTVPTMFLNHNICTVYILIKHFYRLCNYQHCFHSETNYFDSYIECVNYQSDYSFPPAVLFQSILMQS